MEPVPSAPASGDGTADDTLAGIAPSGDDAFSPDIQTASTSLTARDLARETGKRVEALDQRTTTSSLYALPDGSFQAVQSGAPQWVRTGSEGTRAADWQNVDVRLAENGDGSYSPNAHSQVVVVNGGNGEIFSLFDAETGLTISLALGDGGLPEPSVDGPRATFADIARDTDLVVEIRPAGYEYFVVLKTPAAAAASSDIPLVLAMSGAMMSPDGAGGFTLVDELGEVIGTMPPPVAWDSHSDLKRGSPVLDEWSPTQQFAPVTRALEEVAPADRVSEIRSFLASGADLQTETIVEVSQAIAPTDVPGTFHVELAVPAAWANDPATQYPLVLDPSGGVGAAFDTWVQGGYTSDQSASTELKLGTYDGGSHIARSFLTFAWTDYEYTTVSAATMYLWEWHSWSCSAAGWDAYLASPASTSTRWTSQPWYGYPYGLSYSTLGYSSSCNDGWVSMDITNLAQIWNGYAPGTARSVALGSDSEMNNYGWKRFNSNEAGWGVPYLALNYTSTPTLAPTAITVGGQTLTASHRTEFTEKRPVFRATVTDKEGAPGYPRSLHAVFVLYKDGAEVGAYDGSTVASEGESTYTPTFDLEEGANYTLSVASVYNGANVSMGIPGGGTFTTTSLQPSAPCDLRVNGASAPTGVVASDGTMTPTDATVVLCNFKELIEPGDVNGDGKPDLLARDVDGTLRLFLGDGAGGVQNSLGTPVPGSWTGFTRILAPGDWKEDGKVDLITMNSAGDIFLNAGGGDGTFLASTVAIGVGWGGFKDIITPGDFNEDGHVDLIAVRTDGVLEFYGGTGTGGFVPGNGGQIGWGWQGFTTILTPGDFNGDAQHAVDLLPWTKSTGVLRLYPGTAPGTGFGTAGDLGTSWGSYIQVYAPGDFTGDGKRDLIGLNADGTLSVLAGDGVGGVATTGATVTGPAIPGPDVAGLALGESTPALSAVVSDPDGGLVRAVFSLYRRRANEATWELVRNDLYGSWVTSGQRSYFRSTAALNDPGLDGALLAGNEYRVEVRSQDKSQSSASALTTGILTVPPPGVAPDIPAGCDTFASPPSGTSTTCGA